jgi:serine protease inhibitor
MQMLELPYTGSDLSMLIILPKDHDLSALIDTLDSTTLTSWKAEMTETELDIYLPKFTVETSYSLNDYLKELGMQLPFTLAADFSGITGKPDLYISDVVHKAYIDVNEEGTEAAAATGVIMSLTSTGEFPTPIVFDCDHPFLYLIQQNDTGTILFMGSITDPSA